MGINTTCMRELARLLDALCRGSRSPAGRRMAPFSPPPVSLYLTVCLSPFYMMAEAALCLLFSLSLPLLASISVELLFSIKEMKRHLEHSLELHSTCVNWTDDSLSLYSYSARKWGGASQLFDVARNSPSSMSSNIYIYSIK